MNILSLSDFTAVSVDNDIVIMMKYLIIGEWHWTCIFCSYYCQCVKSVWWSVGVQEPFVQACASFLVVRCPQLVGKDDQTTQSKSHQLPAETIGTMLACLQACCAYVFLIMLFTEFVITF